MNELQEAYLHTTYYLDYGNESLPLRIGKPDRQLDTLLTNHGCSSWAFVSAWNPGSRPTPQAENERAHQRLEATLAARGWAHFPGRGTGDRMDWPPEPGFFIFGISLAEGLGLGRSFGQLAIIAGERGGVPQLHFCNVSS